MFRAQIDSGRGDSCESYHYDANMCYLHIVIIVISFPRRTRMALPWLMSDNTRSGQSVSGPGCFRQGQATIKHGLFVYRLGFGVTRPIEW